MPRLSIDEVLRRIEQPVTPRPEFVDSLLAAFVEELEAPTSDQARPAAASPPSRRPIRFRRPLQAAGAAVLVVVVAILVILLPSSHESALATIQEAQQDFAEVPPFHATLARSVSGGSVLFDEYPEHDGEDWVLEQEFWYGGQGRWRRDIVQDTQPFIRGGAGSFIVWDAEKIGIYNALENTFHVQKGDDAIREGGDVQFSPLFELSPFSPLSEPSPEHTPRSIEELIQTKAGPGMPFDAYFEERCEVLPDDRVAGRVAKHLTCEDGYAQLWLDAETGLILRSLNPESRLEVQTIEYEPSFAPDLFEFEPPADAENAEALPSATSLAKGEVAPAWRGPLLSGNELDLEALRGKPVAVYFWAGWCPPCIGEPLDSFDSAYKQRAKEVNFVSISFDSESATRNFLADEGPYQFPVVIDEQGRVAQKWGVAGIPTLVLLDADGRFLGAFSGPTSAKDLRRLLDALAAGEPLPQITREDT